MRFIVNATSLFPPVTGIGRYTFNLMHELEGLLEIEFVYLYNTKWSSELITCRNSALPVAKTKSIFKKIVPNSYVVAGWIRQRTLDSFLRSYNAALYHEPNYFSLSFNGKIVITIHDLSVFRHPESHPVDRVALFNESLPAVVEKADAIVVDSDFIRNEVIDYFSVSPDKVFTTLLGVGVDFMPYNEGSIATVLNSHDLSYKGYFLVVGTLEPRKNLPLVLEAYQRLSDDIRGQFPLVIAGMRGWNLEQFDDGLQKMVKVGQVRLLGYVDDAELPMIYAGARIFLFPSKYEGFGLPPLEAMASGVPVIASNRASIPEVVGKAGILLEPNEPLEWMKAIMELLEDNELEQRLIAAGMQRAREFTWRRCAEQTIAAYEYALGYPLPRMQ